MIGLHVIQYNKKYKRDAMNTRYTKNNLTPKHFAIISKVTKYRVKFDFAVLNAFGWQF